MDPIVIVGAGMAAYSVAREFRKLDKATPLLIIAGDAAGFYSKPMLSNAIAMSKEAGQIVSHSAEQMAAQLGAVVLPHTRASAIDSGARTLTTDRGTFQYRQLVLALGATPIRLPMGGDGAGEVLSVNHIDDYVQLRERLAQVGRPAHIAIIGAGLIGCEFADDLLAGEHSVTLIDPNLLPLAALAAPSLSQGLAKAWQGKPVKLKLGTTVASVSHSADGLQLTLADGTSLLADLVLSAVGLRPSIALAQAALIETARGIVIDTYGRTSASDVFALGDCAQYTTASGSAVMPYVAPLLAAARAIASTLAGKPMPIDLKNDAVIVKTPSYKLALAPPPAGTSGAWVDEHDEERTISRFVDDTGVMRGFGLSAHTLALRQKLLAEM